MKSTLPFALCLLTAVWAVPIQHTGVSNLRRDSLSFIDNPLSYFGGPILQSVKVYPVFVGKVENQDVWNAYYTSLVKSSLMDVLVGQYEVNGYTYGYGEVGQSLNFDGVSGTAPESIVLSLLNSGAVQGENNTYFPVHYDPEFNSFHKNCNGFCATHGFVRWNNGVVVALGTIPDCASLCNKENPSYVDQISCAASHEYLEAVTDPTYDAWHQSTGFGKLGEVADMCSKCFPITGDDGNQIYVQEIWSNFDYKCVLVGGPNKPQPDDLLTGVMKISGFDSQGGDITERSPISPSECLRFCQVVNCTTYLYDDEAQNCVAKSSNSVVSATDGANLYVPYGFGAAVGLDFVGNNISVGKALNVEDCRTQCQNVPTCVGAVLNSETNDCILKSAIGDPAATTAVTLILPSQYLRLPGVAFWGNDYSYYSSVSIATCEFKCSLDDKCVGITFDPSQNGLCYLKSPSLDSPHVEVQTIDSYILHGRGSASGVDYIGNDRVSSIEQFDSVSSLLSKLLIEKKSNL